MSRSSILYLTLFLALLPLSLSQAFRPLVTDDAGTVPCNTFELELSGDNADNSGTMGLCFAHGITERMDLGVSIGRCIHPFHERGFFNAELGLKFALLPDLLSASFTGSFADPTYSSTLIFSRSMGAVSLHTNGGFTAMANTDNVDLTYGLAAMYQIGRYSIGTEIAGTQHEVNWWQVAQLVSITRWLIIDIGLGGGFNTHSSLTITAGLFFAFPTLGEN